MSLQTVILSYILTSYEILFFCVISSRFYVLFVHHPILGCLMLTVTFMFSNVRTSLACLNTIVLELIKVHLEKHGNVRSGQFPLGLLKAVLNLCIRVVALCLTK